MAYAGLKCPNDRGKLVEGVCGDARHHRCPECGCLFFSRPMLERFLRRPIEAWKIVGTGESELDIDRVQRCPCGPDMRQVFQHAMRLDVCPECEGFWLEPDQLGHLVEYCGGANDIHRVIQEILEPPDVSIFGVSVDY